MKRNSVSLTRIEKADHRLLASLADVFAISRGNHAYAVRPNNLARIAYDDFCDAVQSGDPAEIIVVARHAQADSFTTQDIVGVGHARLKASWTSAIYPKLDISSVSVLPGFRSQKIGDSIVANLEHTAFPMVRDRHKAVERAIVSTDVPNAFSLFSGRGLRAVRRLPDSHLLMTRVVEPATILAA